MTPTVAQLAEWLDSLAEDTYPEDGLQEGDSGMAATGVVFCWWPNKDVRQAALDRGANVIVGHEATIHRARNIDPGFEHHDEWQVNKDTRAFYRDNRVAFIRAHRTLDAYCVPRVFAEALGFPPPVVSEGYKGYEYTLVYEIEPRPFGELVVDLKARMGLATVRASACDPYKIVHRMGSGWGGVGMHSNIQYMEALQRHGVDTVIGGEMNELSAEFFFECGMEWIELGHYASEVFGLVVSADAMAAQFPGLPVSTCRPDPRIAFV